MRIVVFGSTGGTGRLILAEALRRGHEVTAFARHADALAGVPGLASVVQGDGRDQDLAVKAVSGQQAVIMTVSGRGQPGVVAAVARAVTAAMADAGVSRLVAASAYGMVATRPYVAASLVRRLFAKAFADQLAADQIIQHSELEWTIARATRLTAKPARHPPRHSTAAITKGPYSLSRAAYAAALLDLAEQGAYPRQIVNITG
jgi:putative NADH-flavin reductase